MSMEGRKETKVYGPRTESLAMREAVPASGCVRNFKEGRKCFI